MAIVLPRAWIAGTPRGYGGNQDWRQTVSTQVGDISRTLQPAQRLAIVLEFRIYPASVKYNGKNLPHGTDLDNLIKETIDAILPHGGPVDDRVVYRIEAVKEHAESDADTGVFVEIQVL